MKNKKIQHNVPLVSVIMTAYNAARFVDEAILSIIRQTYEHMEIIIVDDCSTDSTGAKIKSYAKMDNRIKVFKMPKNSGPSTASNFAFSKAHGKYIARLDADDVAFTNRIEKQVHFLESHSDVVMLGGQCEIIDESGKVIGEKNFPTSHEQIYNSMFMINPIQHPSCMFRFDTYKKAKIQYEKKYFICHDLKILFKLLQFGTFANLPDKILQYRFRPGSITHKDPKRTFDETYDIRVWALKKGGYNPTLKGFIMHTLESVLVFALPNGLINTLFQLWRVHKIKKHADYIARMAYRLTTFIAINLLYLFLVRESK